MAKEREKERGTVLFIKIALIHSLALSHFTDNAFHPDRRPRTGQRPQRASSQGAREGDRAGEGEREIVAEGKRGAESEGEGNGLGRSRR
jgi:hypothetical protein